MKRALRFIFLFILGFFSYFLNAQSTTTSATVVSPVGQAWAGGTFSYIFQGAPNFGGKSQWQGADLPGNFLVLQTVTLDGTGSTSVSLPSNTAITPAGSTWKITVCPLATVQCVTVNVPVSGATQDISSSINSVLNPILVDGTTVPLAYNDPEVRTVVRAGSIYYNTTTNQPRIFNGSMWQNFGGSGGSASIPPINSIQTSDGAGGFLTSGIIAKSTGGIFSGSSLAATNPFDTITFNSAIIGDVGNYQQCNLAGTSCNGITNPFAFLYSQSVRFPGGFNIEPNFFSMNVLSGGENLDSTGQNTSLFSYNVYSSTPGQNGGFISEGYTCASAGDCIARNLVLACGGASRGQDEGCKPTREDIFFNNSNAGGLGTYGAADSVGHIQVQLAQDGSGLWNLFQMFEQGYVSDNTRQISAGNLVNGAGCDSGLFVCVHTDHAHGLGISTLTHLTAPIDSTVYTGTCPTHTATGATYPTIAPNAGANDGFTTLFNGLGVPQVNANYINAPAGALVGYCMTVGSTSGLSPGTLIIIADPQYTVEFTRVIAVSDSTHFTAFVHHPHPTGTAVSWGGGVGWGFLANADDLPARTLDNFQQFQETPIKFFYPIIATINTTDYQLANNSEFGESNEFSTRAFVSNTPQVALTATFTVASSPGPISNIIANINQYQANLGITGGQTLLPPPTYSFTGCSVAPVLNFTLANIINESSYIPHITSGGTCTTGATVQFAAIQPNPVSIVPMTIVNKAIDPITGGRATSFQAQAFNTSIIHSGDLVAMGGYQARIMNNGAILYQGDPIVGNSGRHGDGGSISYMNLQSGTTFRDYLNLTLDRRYFGAAANNYVPTGPGEGAWAANPIFSFGGVHNGFSFLTPPYGSLPGDNSYGAGDSPFIGGSLFTILCTNSVGVANNNLPCLNNVFPEFGLFNVSIPGLANTRISIVPRTGQVRFLSGGVGGIITNGPINSPTWIIPSSTGGTTQSLQNRFGYISADGANIGDGLGQINGAKLLATRLIAGFDPVGLNIQDGLVGPSGTCVITWGITGTTQLGESTQTGTIGLTTAQSPPNGTQFPQVFSTGGIGNTGFNTYRLTSSCGQTVPALICVQTKAQAATGCNDKNQVISAIGPPTIDTTGGFGFTTGPLMSGIMGLGTILPSVTGAFVAGDCLTTNSAHTIIDSGSPTCGGSGGGSVTIFSADAALTPLFTTTVTNATSTPHLAFTINPLASFIGIADTTVVLPTSLITANTCTAGATVTMTGLNSTSSFTTAFASDPTSATGWGSTGGLVFIAWPTTNTLNWKVCNQTSGSITPGGMTLNVGAR